jgi:hypothetical protein
VPGGIDPRYPPGCRPARLAPRSESTPNIFEPDGEHACAIHDRVRYAIPYGPLGELAHSLFVRRDLERIFDFRRDALAAHFATNLTPQG